MYERIIQELAPTQTQLVAVSKTKPADMILELYQKGQRIFGENYVQELVEKHAILPNDIAWHLIGHLQTNKVKYVASFVDTIHSVDSLRLLTEINKQAAKHNRVIRCLLQFHIAEEDTKFGLDTEGAHALLEDPALRDLHHVAIVGVMGMATFTDDKSQVRREFQRLKALFDDLKTHYFANDAAFQHVSMGMSDDYKIAIEEGSTMVRIGSLLFGKRG